MPNPAGPLKAALGPGCVKTFGVIRLVRERSKFCASVRNLDWLNSQAIIDFTYARAPQRSVWVFIQPGSKAIINDRPLWVESRPLDSQKKHTKTINHPRRPLINNRQPLTHHPHQMPTHSTHALVLRHDLSALQQQRQFLRHVDGFRQASFLAQRGDALELALLV